MVYFPAQITNLGTFWTGLVAIFYGIFLPILVCLDRGKSGNPAYNCQRSPTQRQTTQLNWKPFGTGAAGAGA
jgi:hypothetical protein